MSVLSLIKKVKVQTLSFEKHPCRELDQEVMVHYLNGLALITNEDENVCEKEREYLSILINSFGLSEDMLETFVNFAENPDEKLILDMMQSFATKDIKYNFMVDAMMVANIDGNFDENEEALINEYFEMFKITKDEAKDLKSIFEMFYAQDGNALYRYFGKQDKYDTFLIKKELFQYLIDYYKIDMVYELKEDEKKILEFEFFKPTFNNGLMKLVGAKEITTKAVNNVQFCIFLNFKSLFKEMEIYGDNTLVNVKDKKLLLNFKHSDIILKDDIFQAKNKNLEEKKVTGITYKFAKEFIYWISQKDDVKYKLTEFWGDYYSNDGDGNFDITSFKDNPISNEFFFFKYANTYAICSSKKTGNFALWENKITADYTSKDTSFRFMKISK